MTPRAADRVRLLQRAESWLENNGFDGYHQTATGTEFYCTECRKLEEQGHDADCLFLLVHDLAAALQSSQQEQPPIVTLTLITRARLALTEGRFSDVDGLLAQAIKELPAPPPAAPSGPAAGVVEELERRFNAWAKRVEEFDRSPEGTEPPTGGETPFDILLDAIAELRRLREKERT